MPRLSTSAPTSGCSPSSRRCRRRRGHVIAYEPVPELVALLRDNIQLNWLSDRVDVRPVAVAQRAGRQSFSFDARLQGLGTLVDATEGTVRVEVVPLDDDLADVPRIDLLKIDVEGGETAVLAGASTLLGSGRVSRVSCEVRRDVYHRVGRDDEWSHLTGTLDSLSTAGWTFALIAPNGRELDRSIDEIISTEPHANVVARRPGLGERLSS